MSSLLTLNYFTPFPSFSIVDFKQVNVCWENYQAFYLLDICFNVSTGGRQDLTGSNERDSKFFSYFTHSVRCNFSKSSINQVIYRRNTGKYVYMRPPNFLGHKIEHEIAMNPFPRVIFHFRKPHNKRSL